jgi:hypothetical protein
MQSPSARRHRAAIMSAIAAFVFFTLVWHGSVTNRWASALGMGTFMGLVVLGSQWHLRWPRSPERRAPRRSSE